MDTTAEKSKDYQTYVDSIITLGISEKTDPKKITPIIAEEDKLTPLKYGLYMKEHIKNTSLFNIKDAGHLSPMEKPEELNQAILNFLNA